MRLHERAQRKTCILKRKTCARNVAVKQLNHVKPVINETRIQPLKLEDLEALTWFICDIYDNKLKIRNEINNMSMEHLPPSFGNLLSAGVKLHFFKKRGMDKSFLSCFKYLQIDHVKFGLQVFPQFWIVSISPTFTANNGSCLFLLNSFLVRQITTKNQVEHFSTNVAGP